MGIGHDIIKFEHLTQIYGEDAIERKKGCEFYFKFSVNMHSKALGEKKWGLSEAYFIGYEDIIFFTESATGGFL